MMPPRKAQAVKEEFDKILSSLIERGIVDDQNFPVLRALSHGRWEVSFKGAEHVAIGLGDIAYDEIHREWLERRSFNAKLTLIRK